MKKQFMGLCALAALCIGIFTMTSGAAEPEADAPQMEEMKKMMARVKEITSPGPHHKALNRFIGTWNVESRMTMGGQTSAPEKSVSETTWRMDCRWLSSEMRGTMMGHTFHGFSILGYDNFKQSYVMTMISNMDTAMLRAEGDMTPDGKALIMYGTLDEYLTGEHDKMVKYVWRFINDDKVILELHDLPIGEKNTKVMEFTYARKES